MKYHTKIWWQKLPENQMETLSTVDTRAKFASNNARRLEEIPVMTNDAETEWQLFNGGLLEAAAKCSGFKQAGLLPGGQKRTSLQARVTQLAAKEKKDAFKK
ncbi:unnamed protein product [Soboliphyme baturini]|uniref:Cytoplasmic protein n=1 Tax=Soboliphyme baturini TaxID=241478 RepID=A0A183J581_9BILA|nr:unnamed protein product [Soboliphyme baturini]